MSEGIIAGFDAAANWPPLIETHHYRGEIDSLLCPR